MITNCAICNKEIDRKPSHIKKYKHLFCSDECKRKGATLKIIEKYKEYLQIEDMKEWLYQRYIVERLSIRQIMKLLNTNANKGISSMLEFYGIEIRHGSEAIETQWENNDERRKEQSELFIEKVLDGNSCIKDKLNDEEYIKFKYSKRRVDGYNKWRNSIVKKYNHKCDICGSEEDIQTHHLYNWKDYPDKRFDVENGVCLCKKCHVEFHSKYGRENNTPEQYKLFRVNKKMKISLNKK